MVLRNCCSVCAGIKALIQEARNCGSAMGRRQVLVLIALAWR